MSTQVSPATITIGSSFTDKATVTGPSGATAPTGTVTYNVYSTSDCSGMPVFMSTNNVGSTSASFTPTAPGTYRVIATYNGDGNYNAKSGACNDSGEAVTVDKATPTIATQVSPSSITLGASFTDTASLTKPSGAPNPTGTVTFDLYGPGDDAAPARLSPSRRTSAAAARLRRRSRPAAAGTYHLVAHYSGDGNYNARRRWLRRRE